MATGERALGIDDVGERRSDPIDVRVVGQANLAAGLERHRPGREVGREQVVEQALGAGLEQRVDDVGIVPGPAPPARTRTRLAGGVEEDVEPLAGGQDPGQRVDRGTAQTSRLTAAVPMLVEVEDRGADRLAKTGLPGDRGTALAADCSIWCCSCEPVSPMGINRRMRSGSGSVAGRDRIVKAA